jgi:two-component system NarL family sensor kinase
VLRAYALARFFGVPVILLFALLEGPRPNVAIEAIVALGLVVQLLAAVSLVVRRGPRLPLLPSILLDIGLLVALFWLLGGLESQVRYLLLAYPATLAFLVTPRRVAALGALLGLGYLAVGLVDVVDGDPGAVERLVLLMVAYAWVVAVSAAGAELRERSTAEVAALAGARRRLLEQVLGVEYRERRRVTQTIHDEALQLLLAAKQDLDEVAEGDRGALAYAREELQEGIRVLRELMQEMHPSALERAGLAVALASVAESQARRGGFVPRVAVDPEAAGVHDELLLSVARELVVNAAKHARASRLDLTVARRDGSVELEVADDGAGMEPGTLAEALRAGHIGFASALERVEAAGGELSVDSAAGRGTRVRVRLPAGAG